MVRRKVIIEAPHASIRKIKRLGEGVVSVDDTTIVLKPYSVANLLSVIARESIPTHDITVEDNG